MAEENFRVRKGITVDGTGDSSIAGNLGIGTTSPGKTLDVAGDIGLTGDIYVAQTKKIYFDSTDTYIGADADTVEDLHLGADGNISLDPDGDVIIRVGSGTEYVRFDGSEQRVGIGTTSPDEALHVVGDIKASAHLHGTRLNIESTGYGSIEMGGPSGAFIDMKNPFSDDFDARLITDGNGLDIIMAGSGKDITLKTNGTQRIKIEDALTTVNNTLLVSNTLPELKLIDTDATNDPTARIINNGGNLSIRADSANVGTGGAILFETSGSEKIRLTDGGNLGIGTTGPVSELDLSTGALSFASTNTQLKLSGGSNVDFQLGHWGNTHILIDTDGNDTNRYFAVSHGNATAGSATELMRVQENGRVGIGTTSPARPLHVVGDIYAQTGDILLSRGNYYLQDASDATKRGSFTSDGVWAWENVNVGIGTTSPGHTLDVQPGSTVGVGLNVQNMMQDVNGRPNHNLIPTHQWTLGSGSVGNFSQNGSTSENERVWGAGPRQDANGGRQILWQMTNQDSGGGDGGWNTSLVPVDHTKMYRWTVWAKQVGAQSGSGSMSVYLGLRGYNSSASNEGVLSSGGTGSANTNPYFWSGDLPEADKWYLIVGYAQGSGDTTTGNAGSGVYDPVTGKRVLSGTTFALQTTTTHVVHRAYIFYYDTVDSDPDAYFWGPTLECCDGNETPLSTLLGHGSSSSPGYFYSTDSETVVEIANNNASAPGDAKLRLSALHSSDTWIEFISDTYGQLEITGGGSTRRPIITMDDPDTDSSGIFNINKDHHSWDTKIFGDSSTPVIFVDGSSNKMGVGTTSPTGMLHVTAPDTSTEAFRVDITDSDGTADSTPFVVDGNGRVGIGTASPLTDMALTLNGDGTSYEGIAWQVGGSTKWKMSTDSSGFYWDSQVNTMDVNWRLKDSGGTQQYFRMTADGGTVSPKFIVGASSHTIPDGQAGVEISDAGQSTLRVTDSSASASSDFAQSENDLYIINRKTNGDMKFRVNSSNELMTFDGQNQRVGISDTTPSYKLDVAGDIRAQDDMYTDKLIASEGIRSSSRASFNTMQMYYYDRESMGTSAVYLRAPVGGSSSANPGSYAMPHAGQVMQVMYQFYGSTFGTGTDTWKVIRTDTNGNTAECDFTIAHGDVNQIGSTTNRNILKDISALDDSITFAAGDILQIQRSTANINLTNVNAQLWVVFDI